MRASLQMREQNCEWMQRLASIPHNAPQLLIPGKGKLCLGCSNSTTISAQTSQSSRLRESRVFTRKTVYTCTLLLFPERLVCPPVSVFTQGCKPWGLYFHIHTTALLSSEIENNRCVAAAMLSKTATNTVVVVSCIILFCNESIEQAVAAAYPNLHIRSARRRSPQIPHWGAVQVHMNLCKSSPDQGW